MNVKRNFLSILACLCALLMLAGPSYAATETSQPATVTIGDTIQITADWQGEDTINFGNLLPPSSNSFVGKERITTLSNVPIQLSTRASSDFTSGNNTIPIGNLMYSNYGGSVNTGKPLSTAYTVVKPSWNAPTPGTTDTITADYVFGIPVATRSGTYSTTIFHKAEAAT